MWAYFKSYKSEKAYQNHINTIPIPIDELVNNPPSLRHHLLMYGSNSRLAGQLMLLS